MRLRNQRGCLRCTRRKTGPSCWEFLWREYDSDGNRSRRTAVIGTLEQFPTRELAEAAANGLGMSINQDRNRQREQAIVVADLVDHYIETELSDEADWHSHATRIVYGEFLKRWVRPYWSDVDFSTLELNVVRSIYLRNVGNCKTEASRKPVPLDAHVAADLWLWKEASTYSKSDDWIFASPHTKGKYPFWPDVLLLKIIQPAARRAGIKKRVGWHTFRHSYSSLLVANGENVKVVQELMRHASNRFTLDVYSQARKGAKRQAQERVVQMILTESSDDAIPAISLEGTQNDAA